MKITVEIIATFNDDDADNNEYTNEKITEYANRILEDAVSGTVKVICDDDRIIEVTK